MRSQQLVIVIKSGLHLVLNVLYCLRRLSQYRSALTSSSDSVNMTSCVMMFITVVVGDNVW